MKHFYNKILFLLGLWALSKIMVAFIIASQNIMCLFMNSLMAKNLQMPLNANNEKQKEQEIKVINK